MFILPWKGGGDAERAFFWFGIEMVPTHNVVRGRRLGRVHTIAFLVKANELRICALCLGELTLWKRRRGLLFFFWGGGGCACAVGGTSNKNKTWRDGRAAHLQPSQIA